MASLSLWHVLVLLLVLALVAGIVVLFVGLGRRRNAGSPGTTTVSVTLSLAAFWAVACGIGAVVVTVATLLQPQVIITIPVLEYWPALPEGTVLDGPTATLASGGFTTAEVSIDGLSTGARITWALGQALGFLVPGAIAALIAVACFQLLAGRPFAAVVARMAGVTAVVVMIGGLGSEILSDIGGSMAAAELLQITGAQYPDIPGVEDAIEAWWPRPGVGITIPLWPIGAGLGFAALAAVFRYGTRLQSDTELLV